MAAWHAKSPGNTKTFWWVLHSRHSSAKAHHLLQRLEFHIIMVLLSHVPQMPYQLHHKGPLAEAQLESNSKPHKATEIIFK